MSAKLLRYPAPERTIERDAKWRRDIERKIIARKWKRRASDALAWLLILAIYGGSLALVCLLILEFL